MEKVLLIVSITLFCFNVWAAFMLMHYALKYYKDIQTTLNSVNVSLQNLDKVINVYDQIKTKVDGKA